MLRFTQRLMVGLVALACAASTGSTSALADKRIALVLGNSTYAHTAPLPNPTSDAEDVTRALREIGFEVMTRVNADKRETDIALAAFSRAAKGADAALFYYAGHGMQFRGRNYIMPVDAELEDEVSLRYQMTAIDDVKAALDQSSGVKVMILDACRNNPVADRFARSISVASRDAGSSRGLARIDRSEGMVVAYATQADQIAQDGTGRNSPFAKAFLSEIREPGLEIGALFRRIAADVYQQTNGRQVPELSISLLSEYALNQKETDRTVWARIRASSDPATFRDFLRRYPESFFTPDARARLDFIEQPSLPKQPAAPLQGADDLQALEARLAQRLASAEAEQKRLALEFAARETQRVATDAAYREREKALLDQLEREKARDTAQDRQRLQAPESTLLKVAILPQAKATGLTEEQVTLVAPVQTELRRLGCFSGADADWRSDRMKASLLKAVHAARLGTVPDYPSPELLDALRGRTEGLCAAPPAPRVAKKKERPASKLAAPPRERRKPAFVARPAPRAPRPVAQAERPAPAPRNGGGRCFALNGRQYCE